MSHFLNDYKLTPEESARIPCSVPGCDKQATTAQNNGHAPFWYHCDYHAEMGRQLGRFFLSNGDVSR